MVQIMVITIYAYIYFQSGPGVGFFLYMICPVLFVVLGSLLLGSFGHR